MWMKFWILLVLCLGAYSGVFSKSLHGWWDNLNEVPSLLKPHFDDVKQQVDTFMKGFNQRDDNVEQEINKFAHLDPEEIFQGLNKKVKSYVDDLPLSEHDQIDDDDDDYKIKKLPDHIDYSKRYNVTIRDQGACNGGWLMATITAVEYHLRLYFNTSVSLSPQYILDCWHVTNSCDKGTPRAIINSKSYKTFLQERSYKQYKARVELCDRSQIYRLQAYTIRGPIVWLNNITEIKNFLYGQGPLIVATNADLQKLRKYTGGIYYDTKCDRYYGPTHYMALVGYGHDAETNQEYFIVQNSWGKEWGENGFARIAYDRYCGLLQLAIMPVL